MIPQAIRDELGLEPGQLLVVYGEGDTVVLKRLETPGPEEMKELLEWGEDFAEKEGITPEDVERAIAERRDESA